MASTGTAVTLTLGAAFAAGWASTFGKAKGDVGLLGSAIAKSRDEQKKLGAPDYEGHKKNTAALEASRKALADYKAGLAGNTTLSHEQSAILAKLTHDHEKAQKAYVASKKAVHARSIALKAEGKDVDALVKKHAALAARMQKQIALGAAWSRAKGQFSSFGKTIGAGIGILGAATATAYKFVNATAAEGEALEQQSARMGMSVSALQKFRFAAGRANVDFTKLDAGVAKLGKGIDDAIIKGSGPAHGALQRLGLDARALATMPADERLPAVGDALKKVGDETARGALSGALFGEDAGRGMNTLLTGDLAADFADAGKSGAVWDTSGAVAYQNSLTAMKESWQGLGRIIGTQLMPAFTRLNTTIRDTITGNGGQLGQAVRNIGDVFTNLVPVIGATVKVGAALVSVFAKVPGLAQTLAVGIGALGAAFAAVKVAGVVSSVFALGKVLLGVIPVVWSLTASLLACPVTWIVVGFAAIAAGIYALWKNWDTVNKWMDEHPFLGAIATVVTGPIGILVQSIRLLKSNWESVTAFLGGAWEAIKTIFSWSPFGIILKAWGKMFDWLESKFGILTKLGGAIKGIGRFFGIGGDDASAPTPAAARPDIAKPILSGKGGRTVNNSIGKIEIHAPPGVDAEEVARLAAKRIQEEQSAMLDGALADPA